MARLDYPDYLDHLRTESRRFRDVLADCDPRRPRPRGAPSGTPPTCCGTSPRCSGSGAPSSAPAAGPDEDDPRAGAAGVVRRPARGVRRRTPPALRRRSWRRPTRPSRRGRWSTEQTVGFIFRRQAHEALIHRLDAEQTAGDGHPAGHRPGGRRRRGVPRRDVRRLPAVGRVRPAPPPRPGRHHRHRRVGVGQIGRFTGHRPERRGRATTRTTSASSPTPAPSRRRRGPRARRGPRRLAVAARRRQRDPRSAATGASTTTSARRSSTRSTDSRDAIKGGAQRLEPRQRWTAPVRSAASATAASRAALVSSSVSVRSGARKRSAKASDFLPAPTCSPV